MHLPAVSFNSGLSITSSGGPSGKTQAADSGGPTLGIRPKLRRSLGMLQSGGRSNLIVSLTAIAPDSCRSRADTEACDHEYERLSRHLFHIDSPQQGSYPLFQQNGDWTVITHR